MTTNLIAATFAAASLAATSGAAQAQCYAVAEGGADATLLDGYDVAAIAAEPGLMPAPDLPAGTMAILCDRDTVVPDANDFELIRYRGVPLMIRDGQGEDATILMMYFRPEMQGEDGEMLPPQYGAQLPQGTLSDDERAGIVAAIEGFADAETALDAYLAAQSDDQDG